MQGARSLDRTRRGLRAAGRAARARAMPEWRGTRRAAAGAWAARVAAVRARVAPGWVVAPWVAQAWPVRRWPVEAWAQWAAQAAERAAVERRVAPAARECPARRARAEEAWVAQRARA